MTRRTRARRHSDRGTPRRPAMPPDEPSESAQGPKSTILEAPFYLAVDRQLKSGYDTYEKAEKVAMTVKRQYPRLHVTVFETGSRQHIVIAQPRLVVSNGKRPSTKESGSGLRHPASATRH